MTSATMSWGAAQKRRSHTRAKAEVTLSAARVCLDKQRQLRTMSDLCRGGGHTLFKPRVVIVSLWQLVEHNGLMQRRRPDKRGSAEVTLSADRVCPQQATCAGEAVTQHGFPAVRSGRSHFQLQLRRCTCKQGQHIVRNL